MTTQYVCANNNRHQMITASTTESKLHPINGIDFVEIASPDQKTLAVHFHHPLPGQANGLPANPPLTSENVMILGGVRIRDIRVETVAANGSVLTVKVNAAGDFSFYTLQLVKSALDHSAPDCFDPQLAEVEFSFKAGCPSEFDCLKVRECPPETRVEPDINYLAKDYASFRRLMLDRLSALVPGWQEQNPADAHVALVEVLAYIGDHLSYYQDAVATEAYLGTARKRVSVRRHARLLDYFMHDGCNARTWLFLEASANNLPVSKGTAFATKGELSETARPESAAIFETMHDATLHVAHNRILFHTWSDTECCLPKGATRATLNNDAGLSLAKGDLLLFEEEISPTTGNKADADPDRRHVVRLTQLKPRLDPLDKAPVVDIEWAEEDALPFPLCLSARVKDNADKLALKEISVARGNVVLVDHGATRSGEELPTVPDKGTYHPSLKFAPLTHQGRARDAFGQWVLNLDKHPVTFDPTAPASAALCWEMCDTLPAIKLTQDQSQPWQALRDLLNTDRYTPAFVAEMDETGRAELRFGDGILGRKPSGKFTASYRVGNGRAGNVGAEAIVRPFPAIAGIESARNPLPAHGGCDPEPVEEVRQFVPQAFRVQERAVTEADWAEVAQRHAEVQKAAARFRWTGSWTTVFVTIDRKGGKQVDPDFEARLRAHLERYRIAGYDLEVDGPVLVPLDVLMCVCVKPGYFQSEVKKGLLAAFSNRDLPDGRRGYFHPDNFTFGQPVFLSQLYRTAMQQPGVASVEVKRFQRWGKIANKEIEDGLLKPAALEIVQLDNDRNFPENGKLEFDLHGGL